MIKKNLFSFLCSKKWKSTYELYLFLKNNNYEYVEYDIKNGDVIFYITDKLTNKKRHFFLKKEKCNKFNKESYFYTLC